MAGTNLVRTTLTGVRPLGVRGEPLHQAHEQIRGVVRRRLGDRHARLLAEPQPDELGRRIDWYTDVPGDVVPFAELAPERKASLLREVETLSQDIARLADSLKAAPSDDARLTGRALELTARRPSDDYIFLVGDQPVIVAWGYEPEAAGTLLPPPMVVPAAAPAAPPTIVAPAATPAVVLASGPATLVAAAPFSWLRWLLIGLLAILLTLLASYFLRQCSPVDAAVAVRHLPPPPAPPAPPAPPDPAIGLQGDLGAAQADEAKLRATLAALRDELQSKRADCKPPEPPKPPPAPPPPVVEKKPDPPKPPPKPPQVVEKKPDPPAVPPGDDRMRMPKAPTNDYSFLQGCWRTDTFKHGPQIRPGYATYCFDARGNGSMTFRFDNGVTCRAPATARYNGGQLAVIDADANCEPRGRWAQDHLYCTPGADGVASCTGSNRTERWTVNLHRVR